MRFETPAVSIKLFMSVSSALRKQCPCLHSQEKTLNSQAEPWFRYFLPELVKLGKQNTTQHTISAEVSLQGSDYVFFSKCF